MSTEPFDLEQPVADAVDQRREEAADAPGLEPIEEIPLDADEADVVEQHLVVPEEDDPLT